MESRSAASGAIRGGGPRAAHAATASGSAAGPSGSGNAGPLTLQVSPAPYQLPSGLAREVVLPAGPDLLLAGGLTRQSTPTAAAGVVGRTAVLVGGDDGVRPVPTVTELRPLGAAR